MKVYFIDSNYLLRFLLKDNIPQAIKARECFVRAEKGDIKIVLLSEMILEIEYVLRKVYKLSKNEIVSKLFVVVKAPFLDVEYRFIWVRALGIYLKTNCDLVDIFLLERARQEGAEILSFDRDFQRLKRLK